MRKNIKTLSVLMAMILGLTAVPVSADTLVDAGGAAAFENVTAAGDDTRGGDISDEIVLDTDMTEEIVDDTEASEDIVDGASEDIPDDESDDAGAVIDEMESEEELPSAEEPELNPLNGSYNGSVTAGVYRISAYGDSNFVLATVDDSMDRGANLELAALDEDSYGQLFYISPKADGTYLIENVNSGFVIDAESAGTTKGTNIRQYKPNGTPAQNWKLTETAAGVYTIGASYCNLVYDVADGNVAAASNVRLWKSNGTPAQKWQLTRVADPMPAGTYYLKNTGSGLVMETEGGSRERKANVDVASNNGAAYQRVMIATPDNGATYRIRNFNSRLTLDVADGSKESGANIQQYKVNNTVAQSFKVIPLGNGSYKISSCLSNMPLTVSGTNVCVSTVLPALDGSQTWTVSEAPTDVQAGTYLITSVKASKVLDIYDGSWVKGANVQIYSQSTSTSIVNQQFELKDEGDGWFTIINNGTGKVLDKAGGEGNPDNNNVQQYKSNATIAQKWRFVYTGDGDGSYYIMNGLGKYLDIQGGLTDNGTNVQVHKLNRTAAQKWYLEPTAFSGTGWQTVNTYERRYYRSFKYVTGWQTIRGSQYYFYPQTGLMAYMNDKGVSPTIDGKTFDTEGRVAITDARQILANVGPGGKTLKSLLQNALLPCGRVLYIWGGGWGDSDANRVGYLKSWGDFFTSHATPNYDRNNYRYAYGCGLDCSGYMSWVVYNTQYTGNNQASILYANGTSYNSTMLARRIASMGFATYYGGAVSAYSNLKPGDIVSMDGHVWMYLGSCSDGSGVIIHSSPMGQTYGGGVQLSGTTNAAGSANSEGAKLAKAYMTKYFSYWPYPTYTCSNSYRTTSVGFCRWNNDPDGFRNMTAAQVLEKLLGKV